MFEGQKEHKSRVDPFVAVPVQEIIWIRIRLWLFSMTISSIMKRLSGANSSRYLRIDNSASYYFTYNLESAYTLASSSYELNIFAKLDNNSSMLDRSTSTEDSLVASYSQHDNIL